MSDVCPLCGEPVDKDAKDTWKEVSGWVGGPRKDSMRLRRDTGYYAHGPCVEKIQQGQAVDQPELFGASPPEPEAIHGNEQSFEDFMAEEVWHDRD